MKTITEKSVLRTEDPRKVRGLFESLTQRQKEVCLLVARGLLSKQIAEEINISINTVKKHRMAVLQKMQANTLVELIHKMHAIANHDDLIELENAETATDTPPPLRLLIVEDNKDLRNTMAEALTGFGHDVITLASGNGLEAIVQTGLVDIILLDIMLGEHQINGLEIATIVRKQSDCGIIMTTALSEPSAKISSLTETADAYLVKPIDFDELNAVIYSVARRLPRMTL